MGIMVITLDPSTLGVPSRSAPDPTMESFPRLRVASAAGFENSRKLRRLSCLQLTQTALFFPWKSTSLGGGDVDVNVDEEDTASDDENIHEGRYFPLVVLSVAHRVRSLVTLPFMYD
jgi:hypothetical protein